MKKSEELIQIAKRDSLAAYLWLLSPLLILISIETLGGYYKNHSDIPPKPNFTYDYIAREPDIVPVIPRFKHGDNVIKENKYGSGVTLELNGVTIQTGLTSEEILQQLSLDYQDLYDYYGGAEELY